MLSITIIRFQNVSEHPIYINIENANTRRHQETERIPPMHSSLHSAHSAPFAARLRAIAGANWHLPKVDLGTLAALAGLRRQRTALEGLDAHLLRDIGISAEEAAQEAARPVWDVPANWRS
jgi:uncharacterized protein YjiS (DUF1127 family)